jgi:hypothetical protein
LVTIVSAMGEEQVCLLVHFYSASYTVVALFIYHCHIIFPYVVLMFISFQGYICQGGPKRLVTCKCSPYMFTQAVAETLFVRLGISFVDSLTFSVNIHLCIWL